MKRKISPREARRLMQRMGLNMAPMPEVQQVIFKTATKEIIVEDPEVAVISLKGQKIFQVTGEKITEKALEVETKPRLVIPEEDIQLVANQTGKSLEEARRALEETEGDLAKAILLLQSEG